MSKKYRSDAMASIHETMEALHDVGAIDKQTMRRFDDACLTPIRPVRPEEIKAIRETRSDAESVVYLRGDKDVCYTDMMKLLGYIRTAGFKANIVIIPEGS